MIEEKEDEISRLSVGIWKKIFKIVMKNKKDVISIIICMVILAIVDVSVPIINSKAIDIFFGENPDYSLTWVFILIYVFVAFTYGIMIFFFIRKGVQIEAYVSYEIRKEAYKHLQELSLSYYDKNSAGWIMARLTSDSGKLAEIISWGIIDMTWGVASMIAILSVLYYYNALLALIITILIPITFIVCYFIRRKILYAYRDVRKTNSRITGLINESILGSKTTKTLVLENKKNKEFDDTCHSMKRASIRAILRSSVLWPLVIVIAYIGVGTTIGFGSELVLIGSITVPILYLFINFTMQFFEPVLQLSNTIASLQQAQASAERIIQLIETKSDIIDTEEVINEYGDFTNPKRENYEKLKGKIKFQNVCFSYLPNELILDNFSLEVEEGTSVALVGATGSGKSTIVNLLCRFYEPTSGQILIDDIDYKERSVNWLHENLGYVLQSPHLFNGTIKENVKYSKLDATDDEIIEACKAVSAHEFIMEFEKGYDTLVGQGGSKLSVGQRQLISYARAILINPRLLVLDEATSSIDTQTEVKIQEVTNKLLKGRTSFIVAHRLSTIINSDIILVIQDGKIKEKGTHIELLKLQGEYYNLYKNQFINEQLEKSVS